MRGQELFLGNSEDIGLAGLAHTRDCVFLARNIITEGSCNETLGLITGKADSFFDAGSTVLAIPDDLREEIEFSIYSVRLDAGCDLIFHAPIISYLGVIIKHKMLEDLGAKWLGYKDLGASPPPPNRPIEAKLGGY